MLGKLIKNEFKATARSYVPVYLIMLIVTIFLKLFLEITEIVKVSDGTVVMILTGVLLTSFIVSIMGVIFGTIIFIIKRFYDNMLKDEGYLSFTLPVSTSQHIVSKVITSYVWVIASVAVIILSVVLLFLGHGSFFETVFEAFRNGTAFLSDNGYWGYAVAILIALVIGIYAVIMEAYACMSIGQLFQKHRVAGAIITYLIFYGIRQVCGVIFLSSTFIGTTEAEITSSYETSFFVPMLVYNLVLLSVEAIVFTIITHVVMNRKLNLE